MTDRQQLRHICRAKRRQLSPQQRQQAARALCQYFLTSELFKQCQHIGFYRSYQSEIDTGLLLENTLATNKSCYLPRLHPELNQLLFMPYQLGDPLVKNRFGIEEPPLVAERVMLAWNLDVVLVPLIAFDDTGQRLGSGAGYYDRTFAFKKQRPLPILLGLAYSLQQVPSLVAAPWDVPLDGVLTEKGLVLFK